ncbi:MAG: DUF4435 domain-containing protein [Deltaproteobacteria bacterium]|nr:DUF4435 domain-containing protein [Deltaproteobacteria bacterium]
MKDFITPRRTANAILMLRAHAQYRSKSFLVVEGPTDRDIFDRLIDQNNCDIKVASGKDNVIMVLKELQKGKDRFEGVLGVIDTDFWMLNGTASPVDNLFLTDTHDLETMIISSPALEEVVRDYSPPDCVLSPEEMTAIIRGTLISIGKDIGYLRWLNDTESLGLRFEGLPITDFVEPMTQVIDIAGLTSATRVGGNGDSLEEAVIKHKFCELQEVAADPWQLCQGHDLMSLLEIFLPLIIEENCGDDTAAGPSGQFASAEISQSLLAAFGPGLFAETKLHASIQKWEEENHPYLVLSDGAPRSVLEIRI